MKPSKHYNVVAAVIEVDGKVLCMQRGVTRYEYTSNLWEFPGGKVEDGETPQQALHRELLEEMEFDVEVHEHLATVTHDYPDFTITLAAYRCTATSTDFIMREHAASHWLPWDELMTLPWCAADERLIAIFPKK
ncbi:MAG: (deoxy)nucleoside triphosphate pyrophosphohydrolase [Muribaculaceae bacterium]|nr:(deoxy)nucleoside triphosphate pyrophosphohydrolase [Muribaculaceae bacterium]